MIPLEAVQKSLLQNQERYVGELFKLVRQPSISSTGEGIEACAELVSEIMARAGLKTEIHQTDGSPVVYGELIQSSDFPAILIYGHYDIQPAGDPALWQSPPFEPSIRDNRVYARGAADSKGQFFAHLVALEILGELNALPPINLKVLIEGEEEIASPHLKDYIISHQDLLAVDLVYSSDGPMHASERPTVSLGCRGIVHLELEATGPPRDLHSGQFGGVARNPAIRLVNLISSMVNAQGEVQIKGFYDRVVPPSKVEAAVMARAPAASDAVLREIGLEANPEEGRRFQQQVMFNPNFNIAGLFSGYTGPGIKTIIPQQASAKLDIRLVVDQNPQEIIQLVEDHVRQHDPHVTLRTLGAVPPSKTDVEHAAVQVVLDAIRQANEQEPVIELCKGGTVPDYLFTSILGRPSIWAPYANPDNGNHAPNENLKLACFYQGVLNTASVLQAVAYRLTDQNAA